MPGLVPAPDLTLTITPPGGSPTSYTQYLSWSGAAQQPTINQQFGRQGDTSLLQLVDEFQTSPNVIIPPMSLVSLDDVSIGLNLFAGVCNDPVFANTAPKRNEWSVQCTDYTFYADNAVVHGVFYGQTVDQIVVALTQQANCGINADTVANGGFVAPGPQLSSFVLNYTQLSSVWRTLAQLAGQVVPYGWFVDENRNLHFFDSSSAPDSGVTFTTVPTGTGGSATEGHYLMDGSFSYEWDATSLRNRILVQGANQTVSFGGNTGGAPTDTWVGNGVQQSWPLRYTVTGTPILMINGVTTDVTLVSSGDTGSGTWQIGQNSVGGWFLNNTSGIALASGVTIKIWYDYEVPIVAQANDFVSQATYNGPNNGVFEEYISDSSLITVPMALTRAQQERQEYAFPAERLTWTTDESWSGWVRAGWSCRIVNTLVPDSQNGFTPGLDDTFLVISNSVTFGEGGYRQCNITAIRLFTG